MSEAMDVNIKYDYEKSTGDGMRLNLIFISVFYY